MSIYINKNIIVRKNVKYERLYNHRHKYRIIFSDDDYDYVEDKHLINDLDIIARNKRP